ncbi:MAG: chromosome segregation protein SMC [Phycisphaerales bacterium]|nr:chromosome segregation protein SMC [Planctomycetota bacterium]MCH8507248.1 chromosome segregation protein SMC [Phycisphaerales bacterium]
MTPPTATIEADDAIRQSQPQPEAQPDASSRSAAQDAVRAAMEAGLLMPTAGLRLSKLTLSGFKSFADRATFTFDDPITGIVGPNGCGKSNVVDAIKWVLGERSSKSLRGKEMIDVIFAGSAARKPGGMASVTLTFDNPIVESMVLDTLAGEADEATREEPAEPQPDAQAEDASEEQAEAAATDEQAPEQDEHHAPEHDPHLTDAEAEHAVEEGESEAAAIFAQRGKIRRPLPIDTDVVEVERRLYRDGKSQYLINGKLARLRDIRDLFLDTGIGADAYSIIEQGKVDRMLMASPMERRAIFEEAAGIAKYRQRRIEAERKLDKTEQNLAVTREQLDSTDRRLRMVKGQAAKARRFRELDDEYTALRLTLAFDQYDDIRQRLDGLTSRLANLESTKLEVEDDLRAAEDERMALESERHAAAAELRRIEDAIAGARHEADSARQRADYTRRSIEEAAATVENETGRLEQAEARRIELERSLEEQRVRADELEQRVRELEATLETANDERAEAGQAAAELRRALEQSRAQIAAMEREHAGLLARSQADARRAESLQEQLTGIEQRSITLASDREQFDATIVGLRTGIERAGGHRDELQRRADLVRARLDSLGADRAARAETVGSLDEQRVRLDARHHALDEMVRSHEGLGDAARTVLERRDAGAGFAGVVAPLADLVEVAPEHADAVESALGPALGALVVRTIADMPGSDELATLPGRVMFLMLEGFGTPSPVPGLAEMERMLNGRVRAARSLVRSNDTGLSRLLDRLLGSTVLVEDLDTALLLAAGPMRGVAARFVTRTGAVLEPDGRVAAGPRGVSDAAGLLSRRAELASIDEQLARVNTELGAARAALDAVDSEASQVGRDRAALAEEISQADRETVRLRHELDKAESDAGRLAREAESARADQERLRARLDETEEERTVAAERAASLERLLIEQRELLGGIDSELKGAETRHADASERAAAARAEVSAAHERARSARREVGSIETAAEEARRSAEQARTHIERARATLESHTESLTEAQQLAEAAQARAEQAQGEAETQRVVVREAEERLREAGRAVGEARSRAEVVQRDWHAIETSRRELEVKREHAEDRAQDELEINLAGDYFEYRALMADGVVRRINTNEGTARANVLRDEIKKLGSVNLNAIDEETQLSERNEDLIAQVKDIDEARIRLATLIEKLNIASREQFGEVFERIRAEFGGQGGMFRKLFGGGKAEVRLMPLVKEVDGQKVVTDEVDLLESGVEVIAKPPGKEPRSISQLSGGEKTMTAVALLLAIFRSKPSCFCILDEVDAALDEANVGRFCATVKDFTDFSRFIVITHNKRTMQSVDRLYGVTMQERGVSKRVSVRFDQVGADGNISATAEAEPEPEVPEPEKAPPTGSLRAALAGMRADAASPVGSQAE